MAEPSIFENTTWSLPEGFSGLDITPEMLGFDPDLLKDIDMDVPVYSVSPGMGGQPGNTYVFSTGIEQYKDRLDLGADYASINDVDDVDNFYDQGYLFGLNNMQVDTETYLRESNSPAYLSDYGKPATIDKTTQAFLSVKDLTSTEDIAAALSSYYGYDVQAKNQELGSFGGNLTSHSSSSKADLQQFHSFVEPILREQVPYLQATQGLSYQDALMTAYQSDPMLQALYHKYDVKPVRQSKDGSTYLYDPFSFGEIRTFESIDTDPLETFVMAAAAWALGTTLIGPAISGAVSGAGEAAASAAGLSASAATTVGTTAANMATQAAVAAIMGGDPLSSALIAGIPIGDIPIPFSGEVKDFFDNIGQPYGDIQVTVPATGNFTLNSLTGGNIDFIVGGSPLATAIRQGLAGSLSSGVGTGVGTGATPDFNPYINNIAASVAGTTIEEEEERYNIDLANLAALSQQEEAPVTPVTPPPLATEPVAVPVEPIEQPELPLDVAPPVLPTEDTSDGSTPSDSSEDSAVSDPSETVTTGSTPVDEQEEKDGPFFRITKRNNDGSVEAIDIFGNISIFSSDQLGTKPDGTPILAGETYSDETASGADADIIVGDIFGDTTTNVETTDPVETVGSVESPEVTSEIGTVTDATATGDDVTGDSGSGSGTGGGTGNGSGGGSGGGLGAGMLGGAAAGGKPSVTELVFSDYTKRYEAPELQERVLPLQGYQAPQGLFKGLV